MLGITDFIDHNFSKTGSNQHLSNVEKIDQTHFILCRPINIELRNEDYVKHRVIRKVKVDELCHFEMYCLVVILECPFCKKKILLFFKFSNKRKQLHVTYFCQKIIVCC